MSGGKQRESVSMKEVKNTYISEKEESRQPTHTHTNLPPALFLLGGLFVCSFK